MKSNIIFLYVFFIVWVKLSGQTSIIMYDTISVNSKLVFKFPDTIDNQFLTQIKTDYNIPKLIENKTQDLEKVLIMLNWTNSQWSHNGSNEPSKSDALTILKEAKEGKKFRCVEYGIVLKTVLQSLGYKARVVGLMTKDVETKEYGAGHVLTEVWLPQFNKWVLSDGQFNILPILDGIPLNAVEFQEAISRKKNFKLIDINGEVSKKRSRKYLSFIYDYLFYLDTRFDSSNTELNKLQTYEGKSSLMLVPIGAKNPTIFQGKRPLNYLTYTNSLKDFYQIPK